MNQTAMDDSAVSPLLLRPEQAALLLGCGRTYIYGLMDRGELPSLRIGRLRRIPRAAVEAYIVDQVAKQNPRR